MIAVLDEETTPVRAYVQELTGTLSPEGAEHIFPLRALRQGDTLFARVEATSGDLAPLLVLRDYGDKPVRSGNLSGEESQASLSFSSAEEAPNFTITVWNDSYATGQTAGDYRLLMGINAPGVLHGKAAPTDQPVLLEPTEVRVGVELQQLANVDQISERFGAVANLRMQWQDPGLAFNPDECQCSVRTFAGDEFAKYVSSKGTFWPEFTFFHQQGNRWIQNRNGVVWPDGRTHYFARFTTDFQAPDFDFTQFPFDTQQLYIRLASIYPEQFYVYRDPKELSGVGEQLGEEEWTVIESSTDTGFQDSRASYALGFKAKRHVSFYTFRVFVPIVLIIAVSYVTFFLKDYGKRVGVASANLLVCVAFNFTISGELPRLGYLTFMDAILIGTFVIAAIVVAFNVYLKRLEVVGKEELAHRIDAYSLWVYPLAYAIGGGSSYTGSCSRRCPPAQLRQRVSGRPWTCPGRPRKKECTLLAATASTNACCQLSGVRLQRSPQPCFSLRGTARAPIRPRRCGLRPLTCTSASPFPVHSPSALASWWQSPPLSFGQLTVR